MLDIFPSHNVHYPCGCAGFLGITTTPAPPRTRMIDIDRSFKSPNHSSRVGMAVGLIVLHATVGDALSSLQHLCNPAPKNTTTGKPDPNLAVSTHYLITKRGRGYQLVDEQEAAWHAGASRWRDWGSAQIRNGSIGVELENRNDGKDPYPKAQFDALVALILDIFKRHPNLSIVSHAQIAIPAGRKTDPRGFDFARLNLALASASPPTQRYKVAGLPVYQASSRTGALWGHLKEGETIEIDNPANGHLRDGRGFVDLQGLEPL